MEIANTLRLLRRQIQSMWNGVLGGRDWISSACANSVTEAADLIEQQAAEIDRLKQSLFEEQARHGQTAAQRMNLAAEIERLRADAERYQYLKSLLLGANFVHDQTKNPVLEFELPEGARVSGNLDKTIDTARGK